MSNHDHYDVIIIGSGAGGGTLAYTLAPSGKRILILERGDYLPREKDSWSTKAVFTNGKYLPKYETWYLPDGKPFNPFINYYVGGNTKFYGAALLRLREQDFEEFRQQGGISPKWPLRYADFEPYYTRAEQLYHVHGKHGVDPLDPPFSQDYAYPPVRHEPRIQELADDLAEHGYHPFPLPMGIMVDEKSPQHSKRIRCATCDGYACVLQAKADAHAACVQLAHQHPNVTLMTNTFVRRLETDESGQRVTRAIVEHEGETLELSADMFAVCCGAINSSALLLRSTSDRHPNGLANGSDQVGRNYMSQQNASVVAISKEPNPMVFPKTLALSDFYFASVEWEYPMGFIQMLGKLDAEALRGNAPDKTEAEREEMAAHALPFWLITEDLPDPENRITVNPQGTVVIKYKQNNHEAHERLHAKLRSSLEDVNCHEHLIHVNTYLGTQFSLNVAHQCGTLRFGTDPRTSVLDLNCKAHELDNLYAVDGSFFVSSGAVNPTLTIIANALRVSDHLLERLK